MKKQQFVLNDQLLKSNKQRLEVEDAFGEAASCLICSYCGTKLCSTLSPDYNCFSTEELNILNSVLNKFGHISASEISEWSHKEEIWKKYYHTNQMIDYKEAFTLQAFDL